eukprot:CAMPEP_0198203022 /NCGR_PEP_ID=MMETSP1445-20131203/6270_1 /TAXON_ID=36898 /ORGANISM="Pyramimonas sp., Strain CCMP2087" /LENGTH=64 /DNA_ID=CAMNT_0043874227 /DNA_START=225 /DNA_END=416 /DNA_ORIENTATION=-
MPTLTRGPLNITVSAITHVSHAGWDSTSSGHSISSRRSCRSSAHSMASCARWNANMKLPSRSSH